MFRMDAPSSSRHPFPVMDFKFQNSGNGTAFFTGFRVEIARSHVDISPSLRFDWIARDWTNVSYPKLAAFGFSTSLASQIGIVVGNMGWGPAIDAEVGFKDRELIALFGHVVALGQRIEDDEPFIIASFDKSRIVDAVLHDISGTTFSPNKRVITYQRRLHDAGMASVPLNTINLQWRCSDMKHSPHMGEGGAPGRYGDHVFIVEDGFLLLTRQEKQHQSQQQEMAPPGPMFCVMINPDQGRHSKTYSISRKVAAGDVERFQILLGATKSCELAVRFVFVLDGRTEIASQSFAFKIENQRDSGFEGRYIDDTELMVDAQRQQGEIENIRQRHIDPQRSSKWGKCSMLVIPQKWPR
jgi:hypothetical protein